MASLTSLVLLGVAAASVVGPAGRLDATTLSEVVSVTTSADWGRTWSNPVLFRGRYGLTGKEAVTE